MNFVVFNNREKIAEMLKSLQKCRQSFESNNPTEKTYRIKLILDDKKDHNEYFLAVYKKENRTNGISPVEPQIGKEDPSYLKESNCPDFHKLVNKYIDPIFDKQ